LTQLGTQFARVGIHVVCCSSCGGKAIVFCGDDRDDLSETIVHWSPLRNIAWRNYDRLNVGCNRSFAIKSNRSPTPSHSDHQRKTIGWSTIQLNES
jgi:hypothetical protein